MEGRRTLKDSESGPLADSLLLVKRAKNKPFLHTQRWALKSGAY